jgi:hypothetical protein
MSPPPPQVRNAALVLTGVLMYGEDVSREQASGYALSLLAFAVYSALLVVESPARKGPTRESGAPLSRSSRSVDESDEASRSGVERVVNRTERGLWKRRDDFQDPVPPRLSRASQPATAANMLITSDNDVGGRRREGVKVKSSPLAAEVFSGGGGVALTQSGLSSAHARVVGSTRGDSPSL